MICVELSFANVTQSVYNVIFMSLAEHNVDLHNVYLVFVYKKMLLGMIYYRSVNDSANNNLLDR